MTYSFIYLSIYLYGYFAVSLLFLFHIISILNDKIFYKNISKNLRMNNTAFWPEKKKTNKKKQNKHCEGIRNPPPPKISSLIQIQTAEFPNDLNNPMP